MDFETFLSDPHGHFAAVLAMHPLVRELDFVSIQYMKGQAKRWEVLKAFDEVVECPELEWTAETLAWRQLSQGLPAPDPAGAQPLAA